MIEVNEFKRINAVDLLNTLNQLCKNADYNLNVKEIVMNIIKSD